MKLPDAMQQVVRESGKAVLGERCLTELLSGRQALFSPSIRNAVDTVVRGGYGMELCRRSISEDRPGFRRYAEEVKRSVAGSGQCRKEDADYAVDSISFALGMTESEPGYPALGAPESQVSRRYRTPEPLQRGEEGGGLTGDERRSVVRAALLAAAVVMMAVMGVLALIWMTPIPCLMGPVIGGIRSVFSMLFGL